MVTIHKTTTYDQFKIYPNNRAIFAKNITKSVQEINLLEAHPIVVNEDLYIINGQHRWAAAKALNIPLYYIVVKGLSEEHITKCQTQRPWTVEDYLNYYKRHHDEYQNAAKFCEKYNVPIYFIIAAFGSGENRYKLFREGKFVIKKDKRFLEHTLRMFSECLTEIKKIIPKKFPHKANLALWNIVYQKEYNHDLMLNKLASYPSEVCLAFKWNSVTKIQHALTNNVYNLHQKKNKLPSLNIDPTEIE